jgi:predicted phage replisome organizer
MAAKNKRYYWLKLKQDFFADPRIKKLRRIAGGDTYTVILLKLMLLTVKSDGILIYEGIENTLALELALKMDEDDKNVEATLIYMQSMNLIQELDPHTFDIPQVRELTGSESESAARVRKHRKKKEGKSLQCNALVTSCNKTVTTEKEIEKEIDKEKEPLSIVSLQNFDSFVSHIRAKYTNQLIAESRDKHTGVPIAISVSSNGRLYNLRTGEDFPGSRAKELWSSLFDLYKKGKLHILNQQKGEILETNNS